MVKIYRALLGIALIALSVAMLSCSKDSTTDDTTPPTPTPPTPTPSHEDGAINQQMHAILQKIYFWNDDYNTFTPNFEQAYNTFLPSILLDKMTTNIYDRKKQPNGNYRIYSYIQRTSPVSATQSTRGVNHGVDKEAENSFGFIQLGLVNFGNETPNKGLVVEAVYTDSPADVAGIKRGYIITKVDGVSLTMDNINEVYASLLSPSTAGKKAVLTKNEQGLPTTEITSKSLFPNPVLMAKVVTAGAKKIGYIAYTGFDAAYDDELLAAVKVLKDGGADEMILDLRLNGGGHVITSNMFTTCIAGAACNGKVFQYTEYNKTRMANPSAEPSENKGGLPYDPSAKLFYDNFYYGDYFSVDLKAYALNMKRLFVLVGGNTASASEAVINSLQGIDIPVTLIGKKTSGKNTGMETRKLKDSRYNYSFAPISFVGRNAKGDMVNYLGIEPNHDLSDWNNGYSDFGTNDDPYYAKAYELITGAAPAVQGTRTNIGVAAIHTGEVFKVYNPSREGMIVISPEEE